MWAVMYLNEDIKWDVLKDGFLTEQDAILWMKTEKRKRWDPMKVVKVDLLPQ